MSSNQSNSTGRYPDSDLPNRIPSTEGTLSFAEPESNSADADMLLREVGTARSIWLPTLLRKSLPWIYEGAVRVTSKYYPQGIVLNRDGPVSTYLQKHGVTGLWGTYALAAAQLATYTDRDTVEEAVTPTVLQSDRLYRIIRTLTEVGYNKDPYQSTIDDIENGPASLVALCESQPTVHLYLDTTAWTENRRRLREDALDTLARLKQGYHVRLVASAGVERRIRTQHPDWCDEHLTQSVPSDIHPPSNPDTDESAVPSLDSELWTTLSEMPPGGRFALLNAIPTKRAQRRTVQSLKHDSSLDISAGTIDRYYRELEQRGLVTVLEPDGSNEIYLTSDGRVAQSFLTEDGELHHPHQRNLTDDLSPPSQPHTSRVCGGDGRETRLAGKCFEEALRANERGISGPKPRQLPLSDCRLNGNSQFDRLASYQIADGVTLVDERISELKDGRGTFFGAHDSESHVIVQWGGALPTLVRSAASLLSDIAFNEVLTSENLDTVLSGSNALDELRRRMQVGWVSSTRYSQLRSDLQQRARGLLGKIGSAKDDPEVWGRTAREAHGLITSATALFDAAGYDVTIQIRIPDTAQLTRDEDRYHEFLQFLKATVPKCYQYRGHSASRLLLETDGDKLKYRFGDIVDSDDRLARPTASWVVVGPEATDFRDDVATMIGATRVREQVADGTELGIRIPVELGTTDSVSALQSSIGMSSRRFKHRFCDEINPELLSRFFMYAFYDPERERFPSPGDVAETLAAADELTPEDELIGVEEVARGLGFVDSKRLYPWLAPAARSILSALFRSEDPIQRKKILEESSISESSYYRHRSTLEELGLLVETGKHCYESVVPREWPVLGNDSEQHASCDNCLEQAQLISTVEEAFDENYRISDSLKTIYIN